MLAEVGVLRCMRLDLTIGVELRVYRAAGSWWDARKLHLVMQVMCRVVQRLLEFCTQQHVREGVLAAILDNAVALASNTMGNYVIQHVIQHGSASAMQM